MTFASQHDYTTFAYAARQGHRFVRNPQQEAFLTALTRTASSRVEELKAGTNLWRAQIGCDWAEYRQDGEYIDDMPVPYVLPRMKPLNDRAKEGRANPKGIPVLYGASHLETAVAEVRPWVGANVSVGLFELVRSLRIVNFTEGVSPRVFSFDEPDPAQREKNVWADIDDAFAEPVEQTDDTASYVPTQIIAETLRHADYDGVAYRSSVGIGHNIALFQPADADLLSSRIIKVTKLVLELANDIGPYSVKTVKRPTPPPSGV